MVARPSRTAWLRGAGTSVVDIPEASAKRIAVLAADLAQEIGQITTDDPSGIYVAARTVLEQAYRMDRVLVPVQFALVELDEYGAVFAVNHQMNNQVKVTTPYRSWSAMGRPVAIELIPTGAVNEALKDYPAKREMG